MKKIITLILILTFCFTITSFKSNVSAEFGCSDWQCDTPDCDPIQGGCTTNCYCAGGNLDGCYWPDGSPCGGIGISCPSGYYVCNNGCCEVGTGTPVKGGGKPKGPCEGPGPLNCPANTKVDYTKPIGSPFCANKENLCGSRPGNAQLETDCCHGFYDKGDCQEECKIVKKTGYEICKTVCDGSGEFVCTTPQVQNYTCVPLSPPHSSTVTYSLLDTTSVDSCTASAGYMGMQANNTIKVRASVPKVSQNENLTDIRVWFSPPSVTPPTTDVFANGLRQELKNTSEIGLSVKKSGSSWVDIYAPTTYSPSSGRDTNSIQSWTKIGTVGSGLRGEINGKDGKKTAGISNVSVTENGNATRMIFEFELTFYNSLSGVTDYQLMSSRVYRVRSTPKYTFNTQYPTQWPDSTSEVTVDLRKPVNNGMTITTLSDNRIRLEWSVEDALSGIKRVNGDASITGATNPKPIDDVISDVYGYVLGSGDTGYGGNHLWTTGASSRSERIRLNDNKRGIFTFSITSYDNACNYQTSQDSSFELLAPWIASKGGSVFGGSGVSLDIPILSGHTTLSNDSYWGSPFSFYNDEIDYTSELASASSNSVNDLLYPSSVGTYASLNHFDGNNRANYWYDRLLKGYNNQKEDDSTRFSEVAYSGNAVLSGDSNSISNGGASCSANKTCIVKVSGNLSVSSGFTCNTRTVLFVEGATTINPDLTKSGNGNGCIIVSRGNITIDEGTYKSGSSTYPVYDILEALLLTDGQIIIPLVDASRNVMDGLLVHGSLLAFGSTSPSINITRELSTANYRLFPVVAIHFDNSYLYLAAQAFGGDNDGYRREVGFKPL